MKKHTLLLLIFIGIIRLAFSVEPSHAQWIGLEGDCQPNSWFCFRKSIQLDQSPKSAYAKIACDTKYWLWINGKMAIFEGQLKRGPTPEDTYFDEVDLRPFLNKGNNTIALLVWFWDTKGFSHNSSGKMGFLFDAKLDGQSFRSDSSWKVKQHPAYGTTGEPHPNFRLSEPNIKFDARKDVKGWYESDYDDSMWVNATEFGTPPTAPWNRLEKRPILQWKDSGLIDYENITVKQNDDGTKTVIGKLPYNCQFTPYLKIKAPAGKWIDIRTDNYMGGGFPNVRSVYFSRDGMQEYESLGWMNGHDMRYTMPQDIEVIAVKYRETGYNSDFVGTFECDNSKLNTLWLKARRTLYVTMRDNYMDCPDRERAQWWGDVVNELGEAFYVFDAQKGPLLAKKGIYELVCWQRPDDVLYSPVPSTVSPWRGKDKEMSAGQWAMDGTWNWELPPQMLASVGWYGFWTYYWYTGDKQTIVDVYPHVRDYLSLWKIGDDGLIIHRAGDWDWTDWGHNKDVPIIENAWVYLALKAAVEMAKLTGNDDDIRDYRTKMDSIKNNFNKTFWRGDQYRSAGYSGETDDRAQAMAVVVTLAEPEYYPAIRKVLESKYHASPYMEKYVLESLYIMDAPQQAIERMEKRWASQIKSELTTLWEGWGIGEEGYGGGTYNHAWSGGALTILSQYAAGVAPTKPAYKEFEVLPRMGPLKRIYSIVPTPFGNVLLKLNNENRFQMDLTVPNGTRAIVGIPKTATLLNILINDEVVYRDRKAVSDKYLTEDDRWVKFLLEKGQWIISTQ